MYNANEKTPKKEKKEAIILGFGKKKKEDVSFEMAFGMDKFGGETVKPFKKGGKIDGKI